MIDWLQDNQILIFSVLGLIVFSLSIYLGLIYANLKKQNAKLQQKNDEREKFISESIHIIALATLQGQCDLSECCIRVKHLLDFYPESSKNPEYEAIYAMYDEIKKFPTHEARNGQSKQEVFKQDSERYRIEDKYKDRLYKSLDILKTKFK